MKGNPELSNNEISTFAKLKLSSHDLHIEKGRHRKTILSERKYFLWGMAVKDEKHRGSYMSAHVLLNLINELGKRYKMRGLPSI